MNLLLSQYGCAPSTLLTAECYLASVARRRNVVYWRLVGPNPTLLMKVRAMHKGNTNDTRAAIL
jgi:hypothetical protein